MHLGITEAGQDQGFQLTALHFVVLFETVSRSETKVSKNPKTGNLKVKCKAKVNLQLIPGI